jgi:hypothetical protein
VLALTAAALATKPLFNASKPAGTGSGLVVPGSVRLLPLTAQDPAGGPPWGLRAMTTTRGAGCLQVGRLVNGKLGALGRDGAFGNDGRFHSLSVSSPRMPLECVALDANHRTFISVAVGTLAASGIASCLPRQFVTGASPRELCPPGDVRSVYYGMLGPDVQSLTWSFGGVTHTVATVGPEGAYLIVTPLKPGETNGGVSVGATPDPFDGPITRISYRDGTSCSPKRPGRYGHHHGCPPRGYAPLKTNLPTRADVAAPIDARLVRTHTGRRMVVVRFTARIAVTNTRSSYSVLWSTPRGRSYGSFTQGNIRAGQIITRRFSAKRPGVYRGSVEFASANGPAGAALIPPPGGGLLVGHFAVRVP